MMSADTAIQIPALAFPQVSQSFHETPLVSESLPNATASDSPTNSKKRKRVSRSKPERNVKRQLSSPQLAKTPVAHVAPVVAPVAPVASPDDDKKRNKLGYHRTSVACGHCRRRKIRCLIPTDDGSGRCTNCIRLKKECNFFPVDQSAPQERRRESENKPESSKRKRTSPASPQLLPRPDIASVSGDQYVFPPSATSAASPAFGFSSDHHSGLGIFTTSNETELPTPAVYSHHFDPTSGWDGMRFTHATPISAVGHETLTPNVIDTGTISGPSYQHLFNQSHPDFTNTTLESEPHTSPDQSTSQHHHNEPGWVVPPARSYSYGGSEHAPISYSPLPRPNHEEGLRRASTLPIPYQGTFGYGGDTTPSLTEEGSWPLSAPAESYSTPQNYQWPPTWNPPFDHTNNEHFLVAGSKQQVYSTAELKPQESQYAYDTSWYQDGSESYTFAT